MGFFSRLSTILSAKANRVLDNAENPHETLEVAYERQLEMLQKVKRGIVEVATAKKRVELQTTRTRDEVQRLDGQARSAVNANREDLARLALQRKQMAVSQLTQLEAQVADLDAQQQKLVTAEQRMTAKVEAFRTRKEVVKAQYSAAEAQVRISESLTGLSEEMADVGMALQRAEEKTERLKARAGAIDELVDAGTIDDISGQGDLLSRELAQVTAGQSVEDELAQMKAQIAAPKTARMLPAGGNGGAE